LLAASGIGFLAGYAMAPARWWLLIPGGTLLTLGADAALESVVPDDAIGGVFLFGLALTFLVVALAPPPGSRTWAFAPAAVLGILGVITLTSSRLGGVVWPLLVIGAGVFLLVRALRGRRPAGDR